MQSVNSIALQIDQIPETGESPTGRTARSPSANMGTPSFNLKMMSSSPHFYNSPSNKVLQNPFIGSPSKKKVIVPPLVLNDPALVSLKASRIYSEPPLMVNVPINVHARRFRRKNQGKYISRSGSKNGLDGDSAREDVSPCMFKEYKYRSNSKTLSNEDLPATVHASMRNFSATFRKSTELQPFSATLDNSHVRCIKSARITMTHGEENGKRKSLESNGWGLSLSRRTYEV